MIRTFLFKKLLSSFLTHGPQRLLRYAFVAIFLIVLVCFILFIGLLSLAFFLFGEFFDILGALLEYVQAIPYATLWEKILTVFG